MILVFFLIVTLFLTAIQYKCCFVFHFYRSLAIELQRTVLVYFGVSGHGKGLVDAMSAFGAKTPLRRAIITENFDYTSADDIRQYLFTLFKDDDRKNYYTIEAQDLQESRQKKSSFPIDGCQAQHMFSFFPNGEVQAKLNICSCENCILGKFVSCFSEPGKIIEHGEDISSCSSDSEEVEVDDHAVDSDSEFDAVEIIGDTVFGAIAVGNVIGLLTPRSCSDPFYF